MFYLGDVVKLKSGGLSMTVTHIRKDKLAVSCSWFEKGMFRQEWFMLEVLKPAKAEKADSDE